MTGIYVGTSEIKNVYVGTTPVKEIFVGTTKVRPSGWQPGANTIAYYPLSSNFNNNYGTLGDITSNTSGGNTNTFVSSGYSLGNVLNVGWSITIPSFTMSYSGGLTYSFYTKADSFNTWYPVFLNISSDKVLIKIQSRSSSKNAFLATQYPRQTEDTTSLYFNSGWQLITVVFSSGSLMVYQNGVLKKTFTTGISADKNLSSITMGSGGDNNNTPIYLSNLVIENKSRTADEILDYYDKTKSAYGL